MKYALGFYQLAAMSELAIVIRFSVYHLIKSGDINKFEIESDDSVLERERGRDSVRRYTMIVRATYITCTIAALTSIMCAVYLWTWLELN